MTAQLPLQGPVKQPCACGRPTTGRRKTCGADTCLRAAKARAARISNASRGGRWSFSPAPTLTERLWRSIRREGACWVWTGAMQKGYGAVAFGNRLRRAHRVFYELYVGPIPADLELDHLCHDPKTCAGGTSCPHRRCVNPAHLEPVTHLENVRRALP